MLWSVQETQTVPPIPDRGTGAKREDVEARLEIGWCLDHVGTGHVDDKPCKVCLCLANCNGDVHGAEQMGTDPRGKLPCGRGEREGIIARISKAAFSAMEHATVRSAEWGDGSGGRTNASMKGLH